MKTKYAILFLLITVTTISCKDDDEDQPAPTVEYDLNFTLNYEVDGQAAVIDTILFTNDAGYPYSVTTLNYYISEISLIKTDGTPVEIKSYHYASLNNPVTDDFTVTNPPKGNYKGISFNIGLDSALNLTDGLLPTSDNINMAWPVAMGGGYHFMKFEGYFVDNISTNGYALHLGRNENLISISLDTVFTIGESDFSFNLTMNLNEWFRNPQIYDFNLDGNYTMSNPVAMAKLVENGKDVFHFKTP